jgi:hypothetical protein
MTDVVDRIVAALNAHDLEAFVACYAEDATMEDGHDNVLARGRAAIRERLEKMFAEFPELHFETLSRIHSGPFVVQHERTTGRGDPEEHVCIFLIEDGHARRERILR